MPLVRYDHDDGVAVITLTDPRRRNAVSLELADELGDVITQVEADPEVGAVVLTGEGPAFCSGADRDALRRADEQVLRRVYSAFLRVRALPLPTVAAVNGPAVGAGFNLALACDVRIAGASAVFDPRFVGIPVHPGGGHTWLLDRAAGTQAAAAMTLFGHAVDGPRAVQVGLAWSCVADDELLTEAVAFCRPVAAAPRLLVREIKDTLRTTPSLAEHAEASEVELRRQLASVDRPEYRERLAAHR
ncbi:enoyl-CoA hydratase [Amycolatopsis sp. MEPSY49]|uniref:enoyl-CoA hydratase n=1 Tax=Amycolatopsis sp. MEPSY49 TaxID=3151600 RepID=UPI003EF6A629